MSDKMLWMRVGAFAQKHFDMADGFEIARVNRTGDDVWRLPNRDDKRGHEEVQLERVLIYEHRWIPFMCSIGYSRSANVLLFCYEEAK